MKRASPPGPQNRWWGIGHISQVRNHTWDYVKSLADQYGDAVGLRIGPFRVFQFRGPEALRQILVHQADRFQKPGTVQWAFRPWLGQGILLSSGKAWPRRRKIVEAALQRVDAQSQAQSAVRHTRRILGDAQQQTLDGPEAFERIAFSIAVETAVGSVPDEQIDSFFEDASVLSDDGIYRVSNMWQEPRWAPTARGRRYRQSLCRVHGFLNEQLERRRMGDRPGDNFMSALMATPNNETPFTSSEIQDGVTSIVFGGKETAGGALMWSAYLLAQHQMVQDRAAEEVDRVFQGNSFFLADPPLADLPRLSYLEAVVQEAMRLYPPVPILTRTATRAAEIDGYHIPRGATVIAAVYLTHRDERWWEAPEEFRPERFLQARRQNEGAKTTPAPFTYLPFGAGVHVCIGKKLAMLESVLALATILSTHRIELPAGHQPPQLHVDMRLRPQTPLKLQFTRRKTSC